MKGVLANGISFDREAVVGQKGGCVCLYSIRCLVCVCRAARTPTQKGFSGFCCFRGYRLGNSSWKTNSHPPCEGRKNDFFPDIPIKEYPQHHVLPLNQS